MVSLQLAMETQEKDHQSFDQESADKTTSIITHVHHKYYALGMHSCDKRGTCKG